jgi:hypothetical protein
MGFHDFFDTPHKRIEKHVPVCFGGAAILEFRFEFGAFFSRLGYPFRKLVRRYRMPRPKFARIG